MAIARLNKCRKYDQTLTIVSGIQEEILKLYLIKFVDTTF